MHCPAADTHTAEADALAGVCRPACPSKLQCQPACVCTKPQRPASIVCMHEVAARQDAAACHGALTSRSRAAGSYRNLVSACSAGYTVELAAAQPATRRDRCHARVEAGHVGRQRALGPGLSAEPEAVGATATMPTMPCRCFEF